MKKQYNNKIEFWKYTNNKYYDVCYFFLLTPIYLGVLFYLAKKSWALRRNELLKKQENP